MHHPKRVVVVGHGMVGHRFVEALRSRDAVGDWQIIVVAEESDAAYDRVGLTGYTEHWDRARLALPGNDYEGDDDVEVVLRDRVTRVDRVAKCVTTLLGRRISYDTLVLATGSYAFVPPVPGHDLRGCHVYRTLDDLDAIRTDVQRAMAAGVTDGVVIGAGLLGLEAANALRGFGLHAHVVERSPRLMSQQLDMAGGALLRRMVAELGISVHVDVGTDAIERAGADTLRVLLSDGALIDAGVVIFAAGIRPRDELAKKAGLPLGDRGGVLTDLTCLTGDPDIYAIGEVAAIDGRCYGLVGPGYTSAEVVADRLLGGAAEFGDADTSTKLKLLGVDVASFGDTMGATPGCLEVVVNDAVNQTYAKLVLSDDAATLLGGILVGDASAYGVLRPMVGEQLPGDPLAIIAPAGSSSGGMQLGVERATGGSADLFLQQRHQGRSHRRDRPRLRGRARLEELHQGGYVVRILRSVAQAASRGGGRRAEQGAVRTRRPFTRRTVRAHLGDVGPDVLRLDRTVRHRKWLRHMQTRGRLHPGLHQFGPHPRW